jgi:hypothetical protein
MASTLLIDSDKPRARPVWIRPPASGQRDFWCGLTRPKLYELEAQGKIVGTSLREPGEKKGTHLFNLQSILDFIEEKAGATK